MTEVISTNQTEQSLENNSSPIANTDTNPINAKKIEINNLFNLQRHAFRKKPMPSALERIEHISRLKPALKKYCDPLCNALNQDFTNRHPIESQLAEIMGGIESVGYYKKNIKRWMKPSKRKVSMMFQPAKAKVLYQPLGVIGIIVPWNYPIFLAVGPLLAALAAGNRVMIKMSEFTPATSALFKQMIAEYFDEDHVTVITGEADIGIAFSNIAFDHLLFTGSTNVGKHVMRAAANNLTPVTLELGGKSPAIISSTVPMQDVADRIAFGKCLNAGQTCVAPDYILCPHSRVEEFVSTFSQTVTRLYPSIKDNNDYTAIINQKQLQRLKDHIENAKALGATIHEINPQQENFDHSQKLPLTLILNTTDEMTAIQEELFGPILPIIGYDTLEDAINYVNDRPRPLALYYFDYNKKEQDIIIKNTHSGGVCINDSVAHVGIDDLPFGGIGSSGMGHYHGKEGFLTFSKAKGVLTKGRFNGTKFALPPYNKPLHKIIKLLLK